MINRYECITEWPWYRPCVTDDGPWVTYDDHAKEIATLRAENNRLADESHDARQAANGENALRLEAERERDTLRTQLEDHRLAHDDAKAAWEKECSERDIAEEKLEAAERERDKARASNEVKRNALAIATRRLEFGRIWGGMEWVYQPMRAEQRKRTLDEIYAALDVARDLE